MALDEVGSLQAEAEAEGGRVEAGGRLGGGGDHQVGAVDLEKGGFLVMFFFVRESLQVLTISLLMYHLSSAAGEELGDVQLTKSHSPTR